MSVVTPLCAFGALDEIPVTNFRALKNDTDPAHGLIVGTKKNVCVGSQNRDDPIVGSALRTRILAIPGGSKSAYLSLEILIFR